MKVLLKILLIMGLARSALADREGALQLMKQAVAADSPAEAAALGERAFGKLADGEAPAEDLAGCAAFVARQWRGEDEERARLWFGEALKHATGEVELAVRAELVDMDLKDGRLMGRLIEMLGEEPARIEGTSAVHAQWWQTQGKVRLAFGDMADAEKAFRRAIQALPIDQTENRITLLVDLAGTQLRQGKEEDAKEALEKASSLVSSWEEMHVEVISAMASIAAQVAEEDGVDILQDAQEMLQLRDEWVGSDAELSFVASLADQLLSAGRTGEAMAYLKDVVEDPRASDAKALLSRVLFLGAYASNDMELAERSVQVAMEWLEEAEFATSEVLLGMQRMVDPVSPLFIGQRFVLDPKFRRPELIIGTKNLALQRKRGIPSTKPPGAMVQYFLYQKTPGELHYGALVGSGGLCQMTSLGPVEKINRQVSAVIETAEQTLSGNAAGTAMEARLRLLYRSLLEPIEGNLDAEVLQISPVGLLDFVPWPVLVDSEGRALCEKRGSVDIVAYPRVLSEVELGKQVFFGTAKAPTAQMVEKVAPETLIALPGVVAEMEVLKRVGEWYAQLDASEGQLRERIKQGGLDVLHLAGHGFASGGGEDDFRAGLVLQREILEASEIADLDLSEVGLVVLSCCRGGIGQAEMNGNWSSLRRACLAAGADAVMAANWRVLDSDVPPHMREFYSRFKTMPPARALWQVQRDWLSGEIPEATEKTRNERLAAAGAWVLER